MPSPEFDPTAKKILFFSRGRGTGHAIPDIEIAQELQRARDYIDVRFVSYASGANHFANQNLPVIDLELPEDGDFLKATVLAAKVIDWLRPDLVISHEEFGALPAAAIHNYPAIFVTDWFVNPETIIMSALEYAVEILFLDWAWNDRLPPQADGKVCYVGPVIREFSYGPTDSDRARQELGIPIDARVVSVLPGSYATERRAPIADCVIAAFATLDAPSKQLIWVAGKDSELIEAKCRHLPNTTVLGFEPQVDRIMVASDAAITKANRKTVIELESLGIPTIALSPLANPIDDARAKATSGLRFRPIEEITPELLCGDMRDLIEAPPRQVRATDAKRPATAAAERILEVLAAVTHREGGGLMHKSSSAP